MPLEKQSTDNVRTAYKSFIQEWKKIEKEITCPFYNLYILKGIVDSARYVRVGYNDKLSRSNAVKDFKKMVYEIINKVSKYCSPKNVHYEKMLCSLMVLSKCIEGMFYNIISKQMKRKNKEYAKLPVDSVEQIYGILETNIPDKYVYNKNTQLIVFDCINKDTRSMWLNRTQINEVNDTHPLARGPLLYQEYIKNRS